MFDDVYIHLQILVQVPFEFRINLKHGEFNISIQRICFYLVDNIYRISQNFWMLLEERKHLLFRFQIFLLSVSTTIRIIDKGICFKTKQTIV